jgi:hypothetical protein
MRVIYNVTQTEDWGGFVEVGHIENNSYPLTGASKISFRYYVENKSSSPGRAHFRFILLEGSDCVKDCAMMPGQQLENYYSFHQILDRDPGWHTVTIDLRGGEDSSLPLWRSGWTGRPGNRRLDLGAVKGWRLEFNIDGSGEKGTFTSGAVLFDFLEATGQGVLNSAFDLGQQSYEDAERNGIFYNRSYHSLMSKDRTTWSLMNVPPAPSSGLNGSFPALHGNITVEQTESWGGFVDVGHILPGVAYYNMSAADQIEMNVYTAMVALPAGHMHLRLILLDASNCTSDCTASPGQSLENYYSFHQILDTAGMTHVKVSLRGDDDSTSPFWRTGWTGRPGNRVLNKDVLKGFRLETNIDGSMGIGSFANVSTAYTGMKATGTQANISSASGSFSFVKESEIFFHLDDVQDKKGRRGFSFVQTPEDCAHECYQNPPCVFWTHKLPVGQANCVTHDRISKRNIAVKSSVSTSTSGWEPSRRLPACGANGVCSCADGIVDCSGAGSNATLMPWIAPNEAKEIHTLIIEGSQIPVVTSAMMGEMPSLREARLGDVIYAERAFFLQNSNLSKATSDNGFGWALTDRMTQAFTDVCCEPRSQTKVGGTNLWTCPAPSRPAKNYSYDCKIMPNKKFLMYDAGDHGNAKPTTEKFYQSTEKFGWSADSAEKCCELCSMSKECTHFQFDARWKNSENTCILLKSWDTTKDDPYLSHGDKRDDLSCPQKDTTYCMNVPMDQMGPGYTLGWTPQARALARTNDGIHWYSFVNVSLTRKENSIFFGKDDVDKATYNVTLNGRINRGAVWVTPRLGSDLASEGFTVSPERLIFYHDSPRSQTITIHSPKNISKALSDIVSHDIHACDEAWQYVNAQNVQVSAVPPHLTCCTMLDIQNKQCPRPCEKGEYSETPCNCQKCSKGSYQDAKGQTQCKTCGAGTQAPQIGAQVCAKCEKGKANSKNEATIGRECKHCARGEYASEMGQTQCTACAGKFTTEYTGSNTATSCTCENGYYLPCRQGRDASQCSLNSSTDSGGNCEACPKGFICPGKAHGDEHAQPILESQHFATAESPYAAFECRDAGKFCIGGGSQRCAGGRFGLQCNQCETGMFAPRGGACEKCDRSGGFVAMPLAILVVTAGLFAVYRGTSSSRSSFFVKMGFWASFGLVVNHAQLFAVVGTIDIKWPSMVSWVFEDLQLIILRPELLRPSCYFGFSLAAKYLPGVFAPFGLLFLMALMNGVLRFLNKVNPRRFIRLDRDLVMNAMGVIFSALFIGVCKSILSILDCRMHPSAPDTMMFHDGYMCRDDAIYPLLPATGFAALCFIVGVPGIFLWAIIVAPKRYYAEKAFRKKFGFLLNRWHPRWYYWSMLLMLRNFAISVVTILSTDALLQVTLMMIAVVSCFIGGLLCRPWRDPLLNLMDNSMTGGLVVTLMLSLPLLEIQGRSTKETIGVFMAVTFWGSFACCLTVVADAFGVLLRGESFFSRILSTSTSIHEDVTVIMLKFAMLFQLDEQKMRDDVEKFFKELPPADAHGISSVMGVLDRGLFGEESRRLSGIALTSPRKSVRLDEVNRMSSKLYEVAKSESCEHSSEIKDKKGNPVWDSLSDFSTCRTRAPTDGSTEVCSVGRSRVHSEGSIQDLEYRISVASSIGISSNRSGTATDRTRRKSAGSMDSTSEGSESIQDEAEAFEDNMPVPDEHPEIANICEI